MCEHDKCYQPGYGGTAFDTRERKMVATKRWICRKCLTEDHDIIDMPPDLKEYMDLRALAENRRRATMDQFQNQSQAPRYVPLL